MGLYDGLVGYWPFDEVAGNAVRDRSGLGNHGELRNAARGPGKYGQAASLFGNNDSHVSIPGTPSLRAFTNRVTVAAWVFPRVAPVGFKVVVSRQIAALLHPDQFYLGFGPKDGVMHYKWHLGTDDNGTFFEGDVYSGAPEFNRWIHLAGTYDGTVLRLYVDGVEIGTANITGALRVDDNPVTIGAEENGPDPYVVDGELDGLIDEVRLYNRALTPADIAALYNLDA